MEGVESEGTDRKDDSGAEDSLSAFSTKAPAMDLNLRFYQGKIASEPHGATVDEILSWHDDLPKLETYQGYIQWLFPTSQLSRGNRYAQPLQPEEAEAIQQDKVARNRFLRAYLMMLHFYGMTIVDYGTGALTRTEHYQDRFVNLNKSTNNHIRITRILTSLAEMGLERYQFQLVKFLLEESIWFGKLLNAIPSARDFWIEAVKDASERNILKDYAVKLAKGILNSVSPHATQGTELCNCQMCTALRELKKIVPDYQPKAKAHSVDICADPRCICRNKVYICKDLDQMTAQRVVLIEDLNHLTLVLGKISAGLNVVAAQRAQQKTLETPAQIEELACHMDELKQVSIALESVTSKLATLALGEKLLQKKESEMAAKRLAAQRAQACTEEEPCPGVMESLHDATPKMAKSKMGALREDSEKKVERLNQYSPNSALDPEREVECAESPLTQHSTSSAAEDKNVSVEGLSTISDGFPSSTGHSFPAAKRNNGQRKKESSSAVNPISTAKEKRHLSNKLAQKEESQASHDKNPTGKDKDPIMRMTEKLFSDFGSSLDPPEVPGSGKKLDGEGSAGGRKTAQEDPTKEIKDWDLDDDDDPTPLTDEVQEREDEVLEEPAWMKAFRERSAQSEASHTSHGEQ